MHIRYFHEISYVRLVSVTDHDDIVVVAVIVCSPISIDGCYIIITPSALLGATASLCENKL